MKSGSNFTNNCRWSLTGYLTARNNNCHRVEICSSGYHARKRVLNCISRLYKFILFVLHRWKDLKKIESSPRTSCYIDQPSLKISIMTEGNWFDMFCLISVVYTCMHTSKNVFTQGCSKYMHSMQPQVIQKFPETITPLFHTPVNRMFCLWTEKERTLSKTVQLRKQIHMHGNVSTEQFKSNCYCLASSRNCMTHCQVLQTFSNISHGYSVHKETICTSGHVVMKQAAMLHK